MAKKDTAIRFGTYEEGPLNASMLKRAVRMVNESLVECAAGGENVLVLPVEAEYEDEDFNKLLPNEFYDYEVIFYGHPIVKVYDNKKPLFKKLRVLKLPKVDTANTGLPKLRLSAKFNSKIESTAECEPTSRTTDLRYFGKPLDVTLWAIIIKSRHDVISC